MTAWLWYPAIGLLAGILAGLFGIGGGLVIVPALAAVFALQGFPEHSLMHLAVGTSLGTIVATGLASVGAHQRRRAVDWSVVGRLLPGILAGAALGAWLADRLASDHLAMFFGGFEILIGLKLLTEFGVPANARAAGPIGLAAGGLIIGLVSVVLGIGGGTLTVPLLIWFGVAITTAVGTAAACGVPIAAAGAAGFALTGWGETPPPTWSLGYLYLPAVVGIVLASVPGARLGAALAHRLPARRLRRLFALVLILVGGHMLWRSTPV